MCELRTLCCFLFVVIPLNSQIVARDPQAELLLQAAYVALGGDAARETNDTRLEATVTSYLRTGTEQGTSTLRTLGRNAWRTDSSRAGRQFTTIVNGRDARSIDTAEELPSDFPAVAIAEAGTWWLPIFSIVGEWKSPAMAIDYLGLEGNNHRIRLRRTFSDSAMNELSSECEVYLDAQTMLPQKLTYFLHPPDNLLKRIAVEVQYRAFRPTSGFSVPHEIDFLVRGKLAFQVTANSFAVNQGATEADFAIR
jgi:hypothetical protein